MPRKTNRASLLWAQQHNSAPAKPPTKLKLNPVASALRIGALGLGLGFMNSATQAATLTVDSAGDTGSGCTLRDAIVSVNNMTAQAGCTGFTGTFNNDDTIIFGGALAAGGTISLLQGELILTNSKSLSIDASSVSGITVVAEPSYRVMRADPDTELSINNLTITGGQSGTGAGLRIESGASLYAQNSLITGNTATSFGGGISLNPRSSLTLVNTAISNNTAVSFGGGVDALNSDYISLNADTQITGNSLTSTNGQGAGMSLFVDNEDVALTIANSTITNNTASGSNSRGGGLFINASSAPSETNLYVTNSVISGNTATIGGGVYMRSAVASLKYTDVSSNTSTGNGGGLALISSGLVAAPANITNNSAGVSGGGLHADVDSVALIFPNIGKYVTTPTPSVISGNSASMDGGGLYFAPGAGTSFGAANNGVKYSTVANNTSGQEGGGIYAGGNTAAIPGRALYIANSTVSGNLAGSRTFNVAAAKGGGVSLGSYAQAQIINSTVSGNQASGINAGGGLFTNQGNINIENSTFSNNIAGVVGGNLKYGGAIYAQSGGSITVSNSILANSTGFNDCHVGGGGAPFTFDSNTLVESGTCGATRRGDPGLKPLADNGGPTKTHLPRENSVVINSGNNSTCTDEDQRGNQRLGASTGGSVCDIGSVELLESEMTSFYVIPLANGKTVVIPL